MTDATSFVGVGITAGVSSVAAIGAVIITYVLTKKREHEADWRKMKFSQYQEFVLALSGVVRERATPDTQRRYADAVNSMSLVATVKVLNAMNEFQNEISYMNEDRSDKKHDKFLNILLLTMREDINPNRSESEKSFSFRLLGLPSEVP